MAHGERTKRISGELISSSMNSPVTSAEQVWDYSQLDNENKPKTIEQLNQEFKQEINSLKSQIQDSNIIDKVESLWLLFDNLEDTDNIINKWHEVKNFLQGLDENTKLSQILSNIYSLINQKANQTDITQIQQTLENIISPELISVEEMDEVLDGELAVYLTDADNNAVLDDNGRPIELI